MARPFNGQVPGALCKLRLSNARSLSRSPQPQELRGIPPWAPHRETRCSSSHSQCEWIWGFKRNKASGLGWVSPSSTLWTCTFCWISQTPWGRLWTTWPTRDKPSSMYCRILQKVHFCAHFEIRYLESWTICSTKFLKSLFWFLNEGWWKWTFLVGPALNKGQTWNRAVLRITGVCSVFFDHNDEARFRII